MAIQMAENAQLIVEAGEITYGAYMQPGEIKVGKSAVVLSNEARNMEIKAHHFRDLPKYYGMANEDIIRFLKQFESLIARIPLTVGGITVTDEEIRKKVFPICMQDKAKSWLLNQQEGSLATSVDLSKAFMDMFYPAEKTKQLRLQIEKFMQISDESFYEARERFLNLLSQCPNHRMSEIDLCSKFYEGLDCEAHNMVDMTVNGTTVTTSPAALNEVFDKLAAISQLKGTCGRVRRAEVRAVEETSGPSNCDLADQIREIRMLGTASASVSQVSERCNLCGNFDMELACVGFQKL